MCKVFGMRPPPLLVGDVFNSDFHLFTLQPRRGNISVERLETITVNPVGVTSTTFDKIFTGMIFHIKPILLKTI